MQLLLTLRFIKDFNLLRRHLSLKQKVVKCYHATAPIKVYRLTHEAEI